MKKYSWNFLQQFNFNPPRDIILERTKQIQNKYDLYKKNPLNILKLSQKLFINNDLFVLVKNKFPYNISHNIDHYVLFINPKLKNKFNYAIIYKVVKYKFKLLCMYKPFIIFENIPENRSIKDITHYQVFILKY